MENTMFQHPWILGAPYLQPHIWVNDQGVLTIERHWKWGVSTNQNGDKATSNWARKSLGDGFSVGSRNIETCPIFRRGNLPHRPPQGLPIRILSPISQRHPSHLVLGFCTFLTFRGPQLKATSERSQSYDGVGFPRSRIIHQPGWPPYRHCWQGFGFKKQWFMAWFLHVSSEFLWVQVKPSRMTKYPDHPLAIHFLIRKYTATLKGFQVAQSLSSRRRRLHERHRTAGEALKHVLGIASAVVRAGGWKPHRNLWSLACWETGETTRTHQSSS